MSLRGGGSMTSIDWQVEVVGRRGVFMIGIDMLGSDMATELPGRSRDALLAQPAKDGWVLNLRLSQPNSMS
jgi:hypothetical protein